MTYNVSELEDLFKFFNPTVFTDEDVDNFIENFANQNCVPEFTYEYGATKCVIIFYNYDYVIKIPFNGCMEWNEDAFSLDDRAFRWFYNGGGVEGWDYCELEQEYYEDIIKGSGFERFFLQNERVDIKGWPIYIQEKVSDCCENCNIAPKYTSVESLYTVRTKMKEKTSLSESWLATCLENLNGDIEKLDNFVRFLKTNFTDLHSGNLGYIGNQAVILDYAGYYE